MVYYHYGLVSSWWCYTQYYLGKGGKQQSLMTFSAFDMTQPHNVIHGDNDVEVLHAAIWSSDIVFISLL